MEDSNFCGKIIRLAVVAKDYQTYFIPNKSVIGNDIVAEIVERGDHYVILNPEGMQISSVNKSCPCIVDRIPGEDQERFYSERELVDCGYYLLSEERTKRITAHHYEMRKETGGSGGDLKSSLESVHHADICNWQHVCEQNGSFLGKD